MIPSLSKLGSGLSVRGISSAAGLALALMLMALRANAVELPDFTQLVEQNSPAVVNISTTRKLNGGSGRPRMELPDIPEDHPFNEFFRRFFGDREGSGDSEDLEEFDSESLGSGVIISEDGYILTNNHVIADAEEIIVRLTDRRQLSAEVIGSDKRSDIALIKVE
ncbi:MAG: trypsin-like peptidase domain-containing protein, partial [Gammaproteobacteria bacterium]